MRTIKHCNVYFRIKLDDTVDVMDFVSTANSIENYMCCGQAGIAVNPKDISAFMKLDITKPIMVMIQNKINAEEMKRFEKYIINNR